MLRKIFILLCMLLLQNNAYGAIFDIYSFDDFVSNTYSDGDDVNLFADITATKNIGQVIQNGAFTIDLNYFDFSANNFSGFNVSANSTITTQFGTYQNFSSYVFENYGTLNVNDLVLSANENSIINYNTLNLNNSEITSNVGVAINNSANATIDHLIATSNTSNARGAAILNTGTMTLESSNFASNSAQNGGAIFNGGTMTITNSNATGNIASSAGGAIYNSGNLTLNAFLSAFRFSSNVANSAPNDIYNLATLNLNSEIGDFMRFDSGINGNGNIYINNGTNYEGFVIFDSDIENQNVTLYDGLLKLGVFGNSTSTYFTNSSLNLVQGELNSVNATIDNLALNSLLSNANADFSFDIDMTNQISDNITIFNNQGAQSVTLGAINLLNDGATSTYTLFNGQNVNTSAQYQTLFTNSYQYSANASANGVTIAQQNAITAPLITAISNSANYKVLSMNANIIPTSPLGTMNGTNLVIFGNGNSIDVQNNTAVTSMSVQSGDTLTIYDVGAFTLSADNTSYTITNPGITNLQNSFVSNSGTMFVVNSVINNNVGIFANNIGQIYIINSVFDSNDATELSTSYRGDDLYITGSFFKNNVSSNKGVVWSTDFIDIADTIFDSNTSSEGGAIYQNIGSSTVANMQLENSTFISNVATGTGHGGALWTNNSADINNCDFESNTSSQGGAIYGAPPNTALNINESRFISNSATYSGGAIFDSGNSTITNSYFYNNSTGTLGGAIDSGISITTINTIFEQNSATTQGGAIVVAGTSGNFINSIFKANTATLGGALYVTTNTTVSIQNNIFESNQSTSNGGAIYNNADSDISNTTFYNNSGQIGGAIYNTNSSAVLNVYSSVFNSNTATNRAGGAIFVNNGVLTSSDTNYFNNSANFGGAIYNNSTTNIVSNTQDVLFEGNSSAFSNHGTINLNAGANSITFNDNFTGTATSIININQSGTWDTTSSPYVPQGNNLPIWVPTTGNIILNTDMSSPYNGILNLYAGTLSLGANGVFLNSLSAFNAYGGSNINLANGIIQNSNFGNFSTNNGTVNLQVDLDMQNAQIDTISSTSYTNNLGSLNLTGINTLNTITTEGFTIPFVQGPLISGVTSDVSVIQTPIYNYNVNYDNVSGDISILRGSINDAVETGSVSSQVGGYITQLNSYQDAFANMDIVMLMPLAQRREFLNRNKYAGLNIPFFSLKRFIPEEFEGQWVRPYATFESIELSSGTRVNNIGYGTLLGLDMPLVKLKHGITNTQTSYFAYNGSKQKYGNNTIYQNGGTLGLTEIFYKGNGFLGLTANVSANGSEAYTMYGKDDFAMLMAGAAFKLGYNFELFKSKLTLQPSYMMSYTFVKNFDYTNSAGINIKSDPLNAIQIEPRLKIIGNFENGWQPYVNVSMTWNILDDAKFYANEVSLPQLSVKPYIQYGIGLQRRWKERFSAFGQAMIRGGGRNGICFEFGFRWTF